jgi:hypothetical protein
MNDHLGPAFNFEHWMLGGSTGFTTCSETTSDRTYILRNALDLSGSEEAAVSSEMM